MGIFDTVKAYGWMVPRSFPALRHNPSVKIVRHAVALDECRPAFQVTGWGDRDACGTRLEEMRIKEVWFAGDHSDVGGGHPKGNSPLTDATLAWMIGEATNFDKDQGLLLNDGCRGEVDGIVTNSREPTLSAVPNDLQAECKWRAVRLFPLRVLNNDDYPPSRGWCGFPYWSSGRRQPGKHAEHRDVLFHDTVGMRAGRERGPSPQEYLAGTHYKNGVPPDWRTVGTNQITKFEIPTY